MRKILLLTIIPTVVFATMHYLDGTDGNDLNDGHAIGSSVKTFGKVKTLLSAGDTCSIMGGNYNEGLVAVTNSGTAESPIVYKNYDATPVRIYGVTYGLWFASKSYITIKGIKIVNCDKGVYITSSHHLVLDSCVLDSMTSKAEGGQGYCITMASSSYRNTIKNCSISRGGWCDGTTHSGGCIDIGNWQNLTDHSDSNIIINNHIYYGGHHVIQLMSSYNVVRNNYFHNNNWTPCDAYSLCGSRNIIIGYDTSQTKCNIIDKNRIAYSGTPADGSTTSGISVRTMFNIIRQNDIYKTDGAGLAISTYATSVYADSNYVYNNTFFSDGHSAVDANYWEQHPISISQNESGTDQVGEHIKNNIFWDCYPRDSVVVYSGPTIVDQIILNNWRGWSYPKFIDTSNISMAKYPNLALGRTSECIDSGSFLTTITSQSGAGSSFMVAYPRYFSDGMGMVDGDTIQLDGQTILHVITDIDYESGSIAISPNATWDSGQGVSLKYFGEKPDIGAHEYNPEKYKCNITFKR